MNSESPILSAVLHFRLDAVLLAFLTIAACGYCRRHVQRRRPGAEFPRWISPLALGLAVGLALLAEWGGRWVSNHAVGDFLSVSGIFRVFLLVIGAVLIAVVLINATLLSIIRADLSASTATERHMQAAKSAADDANRAKGEFLAVMSHEIRTPLNAVIGFANLLGESKLDEMQRGYVATITNEGARLSALISDILDLTKIEEGRLVLERLPFAPAETAHEVLRLLGARAQQKNIEVRFEAQLAGPLLIAGDPLRFRQILLNLIDNAIKFTARGSVTVFLRWAPPEAANAPGILAVRVRDTGIGIPLAKQQKLFKMFMQADTSTTRRFGGTGLGLAICQRLVTLMGGEISVQSADGEGTEFSFTLPAIPVGLTGVLLAGEGEPAIPASRRLRILVVDDMETNRFLLEVFLKRNGFIPSLAATAEEAIRLAITKHFDAILMDLHMPDLDGFSATQRIRAVEPAGYRTPIIALTASVAKGTREKCLAAGMDEYLTKPLDLRKFRGLLSQFIARAATPEAQASTLISPQLRNGQ